MLCVMEWSTSTLVRRLPSLTTAGGITITAERIDCAQSLAHYGAWALSSRYVAFALLRRLLRPRRQRPRSRRTAEKGDELAPLHVRPQAQETALYRLKRVL
jgi:hypothetical protein